MIAKASRQRSLGTVRRVDIPPWIRCETPSSSVLEAFMYDTSSEGLGVRLRDGSRYFYSGVPASVIDALCESDSAGKVFNQQIRGKYLAVRVP